MTHILLVGNPNCGKTTLFNALTGDNQRIGNWPGVTVEKKTGSFSLGQQSIEITDLPGVYSLVGNSEGISQDERIAAQSVARMQVDCIVNVIDAAHLERHLYLTSQILELGRPVVVALNMMDIAQQRGISIDIQALARELGCPVIPISAHKNQGMSELEHALINLPRAISPWVLPLSEEVQQALIALEDRLIKEGYSQSLAYYYARRVAEGDHLLGDKLDLSLLNNSDLSLDILLADCRYQKIHELVIAVQKKRSDASEHFTAKLDRIVLHRFWALPLFLGMMYLMFYFAINLGGAFQDFFDISSDTIFVQGTAWVMQQIQAPDWLIAVLANGVGKGINITLTFIPVIGAMFFFLSLLETSGYMARAAFVVDKIMRLLGLPGKSFVPMIVGFGCNVPAILAARTLDSERDRLLTVMMSPFMSCSARLAIFAVFVAAFFPSGGQNIVFSLYLMGILMAVFTGYILRKTILKGNASPLILELPAYHKPSLQRLFKETLMRLRFFVLRAGKLIIPICVLLGALNAITWDGGMYSVQSTTPSILSVIGQWMTPLFAPMGIAQDNWPATVGLLTGMLAKEVVVGTLHSLYSQTDHFSLMAATHFDFWAGIKAAFWSIPQNISQLGFGMDKLLLAPTSNSAMSGSVYGVMAQRFDGQIGAYAYLLFVLLYIPCVSTMAVIRQEANKKLMWMSVIWSLILAYGVAVSFYQVAKYMQHLPHGFFEDGIFLSVLLLIIALGYYSKRRFGRQNVIADT